MHRMVEYPVGLKIAWYSAAGVGLPKTRMSGVPDGWICVIQVARQ